MGLGRNGTHTVYLNDAPSLKQGRSVAKRLHKSNTTSCRYQDKMDEITENLFVMWLLTGLSILIMMLRLALRWRRLHTFELGDYLTMAAILAALVRTSSENVAIVYGTNQDAIKKHHPLTAQDIYHREIGSKLTIVNRVFYTV